MHQSQKRPLLRSFFLKIRSVLLNPDFFFFSQYVSVVGICVAIFRFIGDLWLTKHVGFLLCLDDGQVLS